ncbi:3-dehydroquinate synthase [Enterobacter cloacae]|uniref:3-dehydroquinate synthase n=1 Tax=Enterobacter cloacae TaxID=550 RepID=A0A377M6Z2_ENTCL|nr:3-dehydroquinate synthase [Enterobacter cloacae]
MSNTDIRVVHGPANYFSHPGSLAHLHDFFTPEQLSRAVWIYGERALEGARPYLPESFAAPGANTCCSKATVASVTSPIW